MVPLSSVIEKLLEVDPRAAAEYALGVARKNELMSTVAPVSTPTPATGDEAIPFEAFSKYTTAQMAELRTTRPEVYRRSVEAAGNPKAA